MTLEIRRLADAAPNAAAINQFLAGKSFPLQEGTTTTFVYRGKADAVRLRHFIYGLPSSQAFEKIVDTDLWYLVFELPKDSRVEYKFELEKGSDKKWILDPLNSQTARDPFGANSVCHGPGYQHPDWIEPDPESRPGTVHDLEVPQTVFGSARAVQVYTPALMRPSRRYPVVIVHDGPEFVRYSRLTTILDNLIYRHEIPPLIAVLTESPNRLVEYGADPLHGRFIVEDLLPAVKARFPIATEPNARALMGASFGAVASLSTAWRHPGLFNRLLLLSGSFAFSDIGEAHNRGPAFDPVVQFMNAFRDAPGLPAEKIFQGCGIYESLIYENRSLLPLLQSNGMEVRYVESRDGHNWENWRDRLREALSWLFPGPLWMIYE